MCTKFQITADIIWRSWNYCTYSSLSTGNRGLKLYLMLTIATALKVWTEFLSHWCSNKPRAFYAVDFDNGLPDLQEEESICPFTCWLATIVPNILWWSLCSWIFYTSAASSTLTAISLLSPSLKKTKNKKHLRQASVPKSWNEPIASRLLHRLFLRKPWLAQRWRWMFPPQKVQSHSPQLSSQKQLK